MHGPVVLVPLAALSGSVLGVSPDSACYLGRSTKCELVVNHPSVSRRHALLCPDRTGLLVTDLGSTNGTFIDGVRVTGTEVAALESRIHFGSVEFVIRRHDASAEESNSCLDTEKSPPQHQTRVGASESERLSAGQRRVFRLLVEGFSEKRIASRLKISPCTVHNHIGAIYLAFGVHSRAELLVRTLARKVTS